MSRSFIAAVVILLGVPTHAFGGAAPDSGGPVWTVGVAPCAGSGLSTRGIEKMMREAGYDDDMEPWLFGGDGPISYPHSDRTGRGGMVIVRRRLGATTHLRLMVDRTTLGETTGNRIGIADSVPGGVLVLRQTVTTFSVVADVGQRGDRGFYGGVGPSVFRVSMKDPNWNEAPSVSATKVGATVVLGYVFTPPAMRFYLGLEAQCRVAGSVRFGPLDNPYTGRLPAADVSLIHGVLALGLGFRL